MNEERRKYGGLSERQFAALKEKLKAELKEEIWNDIYATIGKSIIQRLLFYGGSVIFAIVAWYHGAGKIHWPGAE